MPKRPDNSIPHTPSRGSHDASEQSGAEFERLVLPSDIRDDLIAHALGEFPNEACGLIAFEGDAPVRLTRGTNVLASPTRYRMDDAEVVAAIEEMDRRGWWLGAIYHSHPSSAAVPSDTDLAEANWPGALMMIVSLASDEPELRAYRVNEARTSYVEVAIEVQDVAAETPRPVGRRVAELARGLVRRLLPEPARFGPSPVASGAEAIDSGVPADRAIIGVLGGMGPAATGDLFLKIIAETPAETDQDHIPVIIYSDPRVPDRTEALLHGGADPVPWLIHGAKQLERMGVSFIVIPCNTAHAFLDRVVPEIDTPIVSILDTAAEAIRANHPTASRVGLLATDGTIATGIYQEALRRHGLDVIVPDEELQEHCVMPAIRAVKANSRHESVRARLVEAAEYLEKRGAHVVLAACTEIPVMLSDDDIAIPLVDATAELARGAVREALDRDARHATTPSLVSGGTWLRRR